MTKTIAFILLLILLSACRIRDFTFKRSFENGNWLYTDSLIFDFPNKDTNSLKSLYFEIQLLKEYPFRNLYLQSYTKTPKGVIFPAMPEFHFADSVGYFYVKPSRGVYQFNIPLNSDIHLNEIGNYQFVIKQFMRPDTLKGVHSIQFIIEWEEE